MSKRRYRFGIDFVNHSFPSVNKWLKKNFGLKLTIGRKGENK